MRDEEFVTHEQVTRWLPRDVRRALNPHEHHWIGLCEMSEPDVREICTVAGCDEERRAPR